MPITINYTEIRFHLTAAAAIFATLAYRAIRTAGTANWNDDYLSGLFLTLSFAMLVASLGTIVLTVSGLPAKNKFFMWLLGFCVYTTLASMTGAYMIRSYFIFPRARRSF
ncbi:hypothetical protein Vadar_029096 [Vaccinium darrowii]|uniref:Uncharacterized protein n=1 Tax=Vaccinium darrowii TaxID=229202 RepID=A0ACB7XVP5_9ERIC|nr:hypothetical protein Vadar_029096 [Vaccinium darrowii]